MKYQNVKTVIILAALALIILILSNGCADKDWRTASRESAGIAPDPSSTNEAILYVFGADAWGWCGWFAIHTWIAKQVPELDLDLPISAIGSGYVE